MRPAMGADARAKRVQDAGRRAREAGKGTTSFIAGASAGLVSSLALQPFEVVKTRMQAHKLRPGSLNKSMFATAGCVVRDEGVRGLWAGVTASCIRTAAGAGLYFLVLERVTREINERYPATKDSNPTVVANAVAALSEVAVTSGDDDVLRLSADVLKKLLVALNECTEWGQVRARLPPPLVYKKKEGHLTPASPLHPLGSSPRPPP